MADQLEHDLRRLAEHFDTAASPITGAQARSLRAGVADDAPMALASWPSRPPGAWRLVVVGGLALAGAVAALVAISHRPTDTVQPVATPAAETTPTSPPLPSTTVVSTTPPPPSTTVPLSEQLDQIARTVVERLSTLQSIGFTTTVRRTGQPDDSNNVVMRADGAFWAESAGSWGSYDPQTGLLRGAFTNPDGSLGYDELAGQPDGSTGVGILMGHQPAPAIAGIRMADSVVESVYDGRPVWRLELVLNSGLGSDASQTLLIDQATGILVSETDRSTDNGVTTTQQSEFTDLAVDAPLPPAFPGSFPPDATIRRSGDPLQAPVPTAEEAAQRFGPGFVAPADLPEGSQIAVLGTGHASIVIRQGFATLAAISMSAEPGQPLPDISVGGRQTLTAGDLAGLPYNFDVDQLSLSIMDGSTSIFINGDSADDVLRIANSLHRYS